MNTDKYPSLPHIKLDFLEKINVSSALKDMIYVVGLILLAIIVLTIWAPHSGWVVTVLFFILAGILILFGYCYRWLMLHKPELLRSENYQLRKQQMEMRGSQAKELPADVIEGQVAIEKPKEDNRKKHTKTPILERSSTK